MLWQVRALLDDRPGAMAALAAGCGQQNINILGLQIFPAADGRVVDELVLHTPGGWSATDVEQLCRLSGVHEPTVVECSPHALEDQPVRYLRAAQAVVEDPQRVQEQLCHLLDASPTGHVPAPGTVVLDDAYGPTVRLTRTVPFTDTEMARASELRRLAAAVAGTEADPSLLRAQGSPHRSTVPASAFDDPGAVVLRPGTAADASAVSEMHARCSSETIYRRYHDPVPRLGPRLVRSLLEPAGGTSMVMVVGLEVVAIGMVAPDPAGPQVGLMVEDRWQRRGLGTRLLRALAVEAANRGMTSLGCLVQPENTAVLATVRRAHLRAHVALVDGLSEYKLPIAGLADIPPKRHNRPAMGEVTTPLVSLLHQRSELREVYPPADFIDQAVRGGA